jgi:son of sevenless-like protein
MQEQAPSMQLVTPTDLVPSQWFPSSRSPSDSSLDSNDDKPAYPRYPPTPSTPTPQPPIAKTAPLCINKPTPPTPLPSSSFEAPELIRSQSESAAQTRSLRRRPIIFDDRGSPGPLSALMENSNIHGSFESTRKIAIQNARSEKCPAEDDLTFFNMRIALTHLPWYLRPPYTFDQLKVGTDGTVKAGTLFALMEKLTAEPFSRTSY